MYIAIARVYDCICRYTIRDAQNRLENFDIAELVGALSWVPQKSPSYRDAMLPRRRQQNSMYIYTAHVPACMGIHNIYSESGLLPLWDSLPFMNLPIMESVARRVGAR